MDEWWELDDRPCRPVSHWSLLHISLLIKHYLAPLLQTSRSTDGWKNKIGGRMDGRRRRDDWVKEGNKRTDNKGKEVEWTRTKKVIFTERGRIPVTCHFFSQENRRSRKGWSVRRERFIAFIVKPCLKSALYQTHCLRRTPGWSILALLFQKGHFFFISNCFLWRFIHVELC